MADDEEGRYTVADCMDETTARQVSFILNHEDIEQILQSHTEEQDRADKAEERVKELEKMNKKITEELYKVHDLELGRDWQRGGENPLSHRNHGGCYTCKLILSGTHEAI